MPTEEEGKCIPAANQPPCRSCEPKASCLWKITQRIALDRETVLLQDAVGSAERINDSCLLCQHIMYRNHMEPAYSGT